MNERELGALLKYFYLLGAQHGVMEHCGERLPDLAVDRNEYPSQWDITYSKGCDLVATWIPIARLYMRNE
ncbi:hypothetical protein LCGC14_1808860 [marine sediment metagenome]|uniref:Uncharacterized protein n=1 Tax=marine sediment metagenome TaxID=412755 RepID=A0A0F9JM10_9ZZZZ